MKKFIATAVVVFTMISCAEKTKIPVYAWTGGPGKATDQELAEKFKNYKEKGIDGLMYNGGHNPETYKRVGKLVKDAGMEFHTWVPTMVQGDNPKLPSDLYAVNRNGESAFDKPAYVSYYKFLCPNKEGSFTFLSELYGNIADVEEVDGIHLDYIRFPDVILAEGLWDKYGLVMNEEYPVADYCYCDKCVADFKEQSGIDIKEVEDPSQVQEWKQFRYDLITNIVNRLANYGYEAYPANPNGSDFNTAMLCDVTGRHLVTMPHIERSIFQWNWAHYPAERKDEVSPWLEAFVNARKWLENNNK